MMIDNNKNTDASQLMMSKIGAGHDDWQHWFDMQSQGYASADWKQDLATFYACWHRHIVSAGPHVCCNTQDIYVHVEAFGLLQGCNSRVVAVGLALTTMQCMSPCKTHLAGLDL